MENLTPEQSKAREERQTKDYWENRVVSHAKDERRMIWYGQDYKFETLERVEKHILSMEMINLARKKYPNYKFEVQDIRDYYPDRNYDIILSVMSPDINIERFYEWVDVALVIISPYTTSIKFKNL